MSTSKSTSVITPISTNYVLSTHWQPVVGPETQGVIRRKQMRPEAEQAVIEAAVAILARGVDPNKHGSHQRTGLVVGYVQSGKTLSFTTVMALARDNGYRLIITIAGISKPLLNQSTQRLRKDLFVDDLEGHPRWTTFTNPTASNRRSIERTLDEWRDPQIPENEQSAVLITVMKNHIHLANLVALLRQLNLNDVPTLIVDDEADQASLNTLVSRGLESTTYRRLLELREAIPCHTFLQYTATPQAPLLINIIDSLSPDFVEVLEPGKDYVGGKAFFREIRGLVKPIPLNDVLTDENLPDIPPNSLLDALRVFLVGVATGLIQGRSPSNANRSMLVHPSRETAQHKMYRRWIGHIFDEWHNLILLPETDQDRDDLIKDFHDAYTSLASTVKDIPPFKDIIKRLPRTFGSTSIEEVNASKGQTPPIDWSRSYAWILIGGQAMDRGFTVEGLTVTYMPRGPGIGNADAIQQRGRFFGYKRPYLGYCRTYLVQDVLTAFEEYVRHEEEMRQELQSVRNKGSSLSEWKRAFVLSPQLQPCRSNVIKYKYARGNYADRWFAPSIVLDATSIVDENRRIAQTFISKLTFKPDEGSPDREPAQKHKICQDVPLIDALDKLLVPYRFAAPSDTQEFMGVLLQLSHVCTRNDSERCVVYQMSPDYTRHRTVDTSGKISNLFQGAAPPEPPERQGEVYPGDREIHEPKLVTIQIYFVNLMKEEKTKEEKTREEKIAAKNVPVIAVWIPKRMKLPWLTQDQP